MDILSSPLQARIDALESQVQEARHAELRLGEDAGKLEFELTESHSSLAYVTTKLHATESNRSELERKLQEAHQKLKATDATIGHLKEQASN